MTKHRVVITGIGVIAPNGVGRVEFENSLRSGRSGIEFFEKSKTLNFNCQIAGKPNITADYKQIYFDDYYQYKLKNKGIIYGCLSGLEAWKDAGLKYNHELLDYESGMIFGSGALAMDSFNQNTVENILEGKSRRLGSSIIPQSMSSGAAAYLNKILGLGNRILSNSSACITGSESILLGFEHLKLGKAKECSVAVLKGTVY